MELAKIFLILRYSLLEEAQAVLDPNPLPPIKGQAILASILNDREFTSNAVKYSFVGFSPAAPSRTLDFPKDRFYIGKTAKLHKTHAGEKVPGDIIEHHVDDWVPLVTIIDVHEQYIFIQKDWRFGNEQQIYSAVQAGLRGPVLSEYNHRVFVEPKTRTEQFWGVVGEHKKIYKVQLYLISPNILETNKHAKEALKSLEALFGQDEVGITLENESGDLKVPKNPIADYVDYIAEGEGRWKITTEGEHGGKKTYKSADLAETVELNVLADKSDTDSRQMTIDEDVSPIDRASDNSRLAADVFTVIAKKLRR